MKSFYYLAAVLAAGLLAQTMPAQAKGKKVSGNFYHKGWTDLNRNGRMEVYEDQSASVDERVKDLLSRMTLEEKIAELNLVPYYASQDSAVRSKIRQGKIGALLKANGAELNRSLQKEAVESHRLGIPLIFHEDVIHGYRTILPVPLGESCCWDRESVRKGAALAAKEATAAGIQLTYAPMVDVSNDPTRSEQNPSLFLGPDGAVWCMYTAQLGRVPGKDNMQFTSQVRCQKSFDGGKTWSDYETIFPEEGTFSRQPIQVLKNGRWIYGTWICTDAVDGLAGDPSAFRISDDQGKTWRQVMMPNSRGRVHATVVELEDGHLVAFMRSREADFIYRSESFDWGDSWSEPKPTVLPNNNSSISAIRTQSGRIAIAYNPTSVSEDMRSKCAWPGLRCPVAVALSEDGGLTFPMIRWMERGEGYIGDENKTNNKQYEYPYIMQGTDGRLHLTYAAFTRKAVKYVSFTEEDVMGAKRERYGVYNPTNGEGARDAR